MKPDDQKMPSGMVERVARAINPYAFAVLDAGEGDITLPGNIAHARNQARAAIQAMRKPTEAMVNAGWEDGQAGFGEGEDVPLIWKAMIDEALK